MPRGRNKANNGKKSKVVKTREKGVNKMISEDKARKAKSKAIKGGSAGSAYRGGDRSGF